MDIRAFRALRRRKRQAKVTQVPAMPYARRLAVYYRQNGTGAWTGLAGLTPRQRRRLDHKANSGRGA